VPDSNLKLLENAALILGRNSQIGAFKAIDAVRTTAKEIVAGKPLSWRELFDSSGNNDILTSLTKANLTQDDVNSYRKRRSGSLSLIENSIIELMKMGKLTMSQIEDEVYNAFHRAPRITMPEATYDALVAAQPLQVDYQYAFTKNRLRTVEAILAYSDKNALEAFEMMRTLSGKETAELPRTLQDYQKWAIETVEALVTNKTVMTLDSAMAILKLNAADKIPLYTDLLFTSDSFKGQINHIITNGVKAKPVFKHVTPTLRNAFRDTYDGWLDITNSTALLAANNYLRYVFGLASVEKYPDFVAPPLATQLEKLSYHTTVNNAGHNIHQLYNHVVETEKTQLQAGQNFSVARLGKAYYGGAVQGLNNISRVLLQILFEPARVTAADNLREFGVDTNTALQIAGRTSLESVNHLEDFVIHSLPKSYLIMGSERRFEELTPRDLEALDNLINAQHLEPAVALEEFQNFNIDALLSAERKQQYAMYNLAIWSLLNCSGAVTQKIFANATYLLDVVDNENLLKSVAKKLVACIDTHVNATHENDRYLSGFLSPVQHVENSFDPVFLFSMMMIALTMAAVATQYICRKTLPTANNRYRLLQTGHKRNDSDDEQKEMGERDRLLPTSP
jgi:hypothetical protein